MGLREQTNEVVSELANREGKKHEATVGDCREIIKVLRGMHKEGFPVVAVITADPAPKVKARKKAVRKKK